MRVVVDTNVFISAALKRTSTPSDAVRLVDERHVLLKSAKTVQELFITLARPHLALLIPKNFQAWLEAIIDKAELVRIGESVAACRDPKDDKFLELAVNGQADLIVSGDADLLALDPFRGIPIVAPAVFVRHARG